MFNKENGSQTLIQEKSKNTSGSILNKFKKTDIVLDNEFRKRNEEIKKLETTEQQENKEQLQQIQQKIARLKEALLQVAEEKIETSASDSTQLENLQQKNTNLTEQLQRANAENAKLQAAQLSQQAEKLQQEKANLQNQIKDISTNDYKFKRNLATSSVAGMVLSELGVLASYELVPHEFFKLVLEISLSALAICFVCSVFFAVKAYQANATLFANDPATSANDLESKDDLHSTTAAPITTT